jgi:nitrate reductase delta subunit
MMKLPRLNLHLHRGPASQERPPYQLLSVLLRYPDRRLQEAGEELSAAVDALPPGQAGEAIRRFWSYWSSTSPTEREACYVETFDLQKRCGLHLSYYLHGDRRQRGVALLHLKRMYAAAGLVLEPSELPDYLPVMLEFAAFAPPGYGETVLRQFRPALELVRLGLHDLESPYAHLLDALCAGLPRLSPLEATQVTRLIAQGPPSEQVGLEPFAPPEVMPRSEAHR